MTIFEKFQQYGAALKEKRRQYHYPKARLPAEDSFDEDS
jgi:hypothetical protein